MNQTERLHIINDKKPNQAGHYILYWMDQSLRIRDNYSLNHAIELANKYKKPLLILYIIDLSYPLLNSRHYEFILEGLNSLRRDLYSGGIRLQIEIDKKVACVQRYGKEAVEVIGDYSYLKEDNDIRSKIKLPCSFKLFESELTVPVSIASTKEEYAARTFRPRIHEKLSYFISKTNTPKVFVESLNLDFPNNFSFYPNMKPFIDKLKLKPYINPIKLASGERKAVKLIRDFIEKGLSYYNEGRNIVGENYQSNISPYLNFGQISPIRILNTLEKHSDANRDRFVEQLVVRRELSYNFVHYNTNYENFNSLPDWAKQTLQDHSDDKREYIYTLKQLEDAETHDVYWNAAQKEMLVTGKMHGYMRMYWGKKIIEWTKDPLDAYEIALYLNNKYSIDGFSPNGYAGVAWCFGKHDTAWKERPIFGKVRYMNDKGLERKFDMTAYIDKINML